MGMTARGTPTLNRTWKEAVHPPRVKPYQKQQQQQREVKNMVNLKQWFSTRAKIFALAPAPTSGVFVNV